MCIRDSTMITKCKGISTNFSNVEVGEALWCSGHIGVYIGGGLAVEDQFTGFLKQFFRTSRLHNLLRALG